MVYSSSISISTPALNTALNLFRIIAHKPCKHNQTPSKKYKTNTKPSSATAAILPGIFRFLPSFAGSSCLIRIGKIFRMTIAEIALYVVSVLS